ncbi:MAG: Gfo/Idh/MocA family oxidoreductase, partial [Myxococcaceae bacterium]|nr:Gfo/Idh/MocA family oxidoreductase [Myxococcaceae bacterium]
MVLSLRVGLLGAGDAAGHHARALGALHADATARWAGVCARDPARVAAFCEAHGAPPDALRATDLDAFLDPAALDAVVIATPDGLHPAHATLAAARGLHVLVEKPLAL